MQPVFAQSLDDPRPLGSVIILAGPYPCDADICYDLQISCPSLAEAGQITLKVSEPTGAPEKGTIVFFTGWTGDFYWEGLSTEAPRVLSELRAAGFRTVQTKWASNWWLGAEYQNEGYAKLACKSATVMNWVYSNLHPNTQTAYCATGHSNGASLVAYALSQYGQASILSAALLDAGPNYARLDHACIQDDPNYSNLWYSEDSRIDVDKSFGYRIFFGKEPCFTKNSNYRSMFQDASLAFGDWQFTYLYTMIGFTFGQNDTTTTRYHGIHYYDHLVHAGTPLISMTVVPGTGHTTVATVAGANTVRDFFINQCILRTPTSIGLTSFGATVPSGYQKMEFAGMVILIIVMGGLLIRRMGRSQSNV